MNVYVREYKKIEHRTRRRDNFVLRYLPILLLLGMAVVVGKVYVQAVALRWSNRVMELKSGARDLELRNEDLTRAIAGLQTRERITRDAGRRLDMVTQTEEDVVWLPVVERAPARGGARRAGDDAGPGAAVTEWLDAFWQEEALALTSQ